MAHSCPYCGATLKLNFCVVCGRQSDSNKMGNLRSAARNTEATLRLDDPLGVKSKRDAQKSLRFKKRFRLFNFLLGLLIIAILVFCAVKQAVNLKKNVSTHKSARISIPVHKLDHANRAHKTNKR